MDLKTITWSAVAGGVLWEVIRQAITRLFRREQESAETTRKLLREDIESVVKLTCEVHELAVSYFAMDSTCDDALDVSRQIKGKLKTGGMQISTLNLHLNEKGHSKVELSLWTRFKSATTKDLDVKREEAWDDGDPRLNDIYRAANNLHMALSRARYATV